MFNSAAYTANASTTGAPFDGPIKQLNSIGAVPAGTLQLSGTWTAVNDTNSFFNAVPITTISGTTTVATTETYAFAAGTYPSPLATPVVPILQYDSAAAGSGATATWTFTGLIPGETYQMNAIEQAVGGGIAQYVVTDGSGAVLTAGNVNQSPGTLPSFINSGTVVETVTTITSTPTSSATVTSTGTYTYAPTYYESEIGQFVATGSTAVLTMAAAPGSAVIADTALLLPVGVNGGADDNFHVQPGSPAIDAGDPTSPFLAEPAPNGGRVNQGYDGNTAQAQLSASAQSLQVLSPGGLAKYAVGEQMPINFQTTGLTTTQPVLLLHAGGASITTGLDGNWSADAFRTTGQSVSDTQSAANIGTLPGVPTALFSTAADLASATAGQKLSFQLPVPDGTYTLQLYFADPSASGTGQRVFNIVANGVTLQANYDIFAAAKTQFSDGYHAVSLTLSVTVTGGNGLELDFVNVAGDAYGALVNGIALEQQNSGGTASPTATVEVSTDGGTTWTPIATSVPINALGQGQYVWTVNTTSTGNTALVQVISGAIGGTSQPFLLANGGTNFYVNDASQAGDQYTTAPGNDANSGKSPDQPMANSRLCCAPTRSVPATRSMSIPAPIVCWRIFFFRPPTAAPPPTRC